MSELLANGVKARVGLRGLAIDQLTEEQVVQHVLDQLRAGRGGWVSTLNVDIWRAACRDPALQRLISGASLLVADGMPVVWASRLHRTPLPERVAGSSLILTLSRAAARERRSIYLLGSDAGVAELAAGTLGRRYPGLRIAGTYSPPVGFDATAAGIADVCDMLSAAAPDIVYVGLGFPKQERLIADVAVALPGSWFVACGAAIKFASGVLCRAPVWMQQVGLEWLFRLATEPRRLARRYLIDDFPFAVALLASSVAERSRRSGGPPFEITSGELRGPERWGG